MKLRLSCGSNLLFSNYAAEGCVRLEAVIRSVRKTHPKIYTGWCDSDGQLRSSLPVFVNGEHVRYKKGMKTELHDGDEVYIVPFVAGG